MITPFPARASPIEPIEPVRPRGFPLSLSFFFPPLLSSWQIFIPARAGMGDERARACVPAAARSRVALSVKKPRGARARARAAQETRLHTKSKLFRFNTT